MRGSGVRGFVYYRLFRWEWVNLCHSINHTCACACVCVRVFDQIQVDVQKSEKSSDRLVICTGRGNILLCQLSLARIDVRNYVLMHYIETKLETSTCL